MTVHIQPCVAGCDTSCLFMGSVLWIPIVFAVATCFLYFLSVSHPHQKDHSSNETSLKFPTNFEELTTLASLLDQYKSDHAGYVYILFSTAYLYKQTFAIPGSVFLNILAGALFGTWQGFTLVCVLTACGATFCFLLSWYFGRKLIVKYFPEKIKCIQEKVQENMGHLFSFLLFVRLFPMSPNWFMNMVSPIIDIPVHLFFFSVLIGLMPYNFICVQTGSMLAQITSMEDVFTKWTLIKLFGLAVISLMPGIIMNQMKASKIKSN